MIKITIKVAEDARVIDLADLFRVINDNGFLFEISDEKSSPKPTRGVTSIGVPVAHIKQGTE